MGAGTYPLIKKTELKNLMLKSLQVMLHPGSPGAWSYWQVKVNLRAWLVTGKILTLNEKSNV